MRGIALLLTLSTGCATSVTEGINMGQKGLAVIDVGVDKAADEYIEAVQAIRAHCAGDKACEAKYRVTDADVRKVADAAEVLSDVYDDMARILDVAATTWTFVQAQAELAKGTVDGLAE